MRSDITKIKWFLSLRLMQSELKTENISDKTERFCGGVIITGYHWLSVAIRLPLTED